MNESEIRVHVRRALGETSYPPALRDGVVRRLERPPRRDHSTALTMVAAIVALAIVATLVLVRVHALPRSTPAATPTQASPGARVSVPLGPPFVANSHVPAGDLAAAMFNDTTAALVTQLNISATNNGRTVTLIGAYADSSRTVVFFRTVPPVGQPHVTIFDDQGFINGGGSGGGGGSFGDFFYVRDAGPRSGADGMANLRVLLDGFGGDFGEPLVNGQWSFSFALRVLPSTLLTLTPPLQSVGNWKFTDVVLEASPTTITFRAVIDGATVQDASTLGIVFLPLGIYSGAGPSTPKGATTPTVGGFPVVYAWFRPRAAGTFTFSFSGGGGSYTGTVFIPPVPATAPLKGAPIVPTDFAPSSESLQINGAFYAAIKQGFPSQCGFGSGSSGALFAFATWFGLDGEWYLITLATDPKIQPYHGPGTYPGTATIYPYAAFGADPIFAGTVELTVGSDKSPDNGSVRGTLGWVGTSGSASTISVSGEWSCTPSPALGPG